MGRLSTRELLGTWPSNWCSVLKLKLDMQQEIINSCVMSMSQETLPWLKEAQVTWDHPNKASEGCWHSLLNLQAWEDDVVPLLLGKKDKVKIEVNKTMNPAFLLGTAFKRAYWHRKYHSGTICKGVSNAQASNALSG